MSDYFVGELRVFAYNRVPQGWLPCDGRLLNITGNTALYSLLGVQFGGDAKTTFALPDLRGQVTVGRAVYNYQNFPFPTGTKGGSETIVLTSAQMPPHTHTIGAVSATTAAVALHPVAPPNNGYISEAKQVNATGAPAFDIYAPAPASTPTSNWAALDGSTLTNVGANAGHENRQPVLPLQICISTTGIYPSRN
jgi:microcystin-dependent protein